MKCKKALFLVLLIIKSSDSACAMFVGLDSWLLFFFQACVDEISAQEPNITETPQAGIPTLHLMGQQRNDHVTFVSRPGESVNQTPKIAYHMYSFLKQYVLSNYIPIVLTSESDVPLNSWVDVLAAAKEKKPTIDDGYKREITRFFNELTEQYGLGEDDVTDLFNTIVPTFFKGLHAQFDKRGYGIEFMYWLHTASTDFYNMTVAEYPSLVIVENEYDLEKLIPQRGVLPLAHSVVTNLSDLDLYS